MAASIKGMIRTFIIQNKKLTQQIPLNKIKSFLKKRDVTVWVDLEKPTPKDYDILREIFMFHPLAIEDCIKPINLPKVDIYEKYVFVVLHGAVSDFEKVDFKRREIDFFLGKNYLVTVHSYKSTGVDYVIEKMHNNKVIINKADFLMYEIIDVTVDQHFPLLDDWEDHIEELEEDIIKNKHKSDAPKKVLDIKKEILHLRKSISPQIDVINKFTKNDFPLISETTKIYFKDVHDHLMRIYAELETQRDLLKNALDAHTTLINKQRTADSHKMNQVMQKLTIIATIFMPLTFITGIYGMNFKYLPELYWRYGYYIIMLGMALIGVFMFWFFKKKDWV